jgi:membrane protease subunit HflK
MKRLLGLVLIAAAAWSASGIYFVAPDEVVLIRRCGRLLPLPRLPGAHAGLPWGVDLRERVKPQEVKRVSVGLVSVAGELSGSASTPFLSADRNLVHARATVQYTISEPMEYVRQEHTADRLVATAGEGSLARILAGQAIDTLLTHGKTAVAARVQADLQQTLDGYGLGITIRSVDLGGLEPPPEVAGAFADVVAAQREREQTINEARSAAGGTIAQARATAQRTLDAARGESERRTHEAAGEAERFERMLAEYRRSPALTASRLYWDAMSEILPRLRAKLLVDRGQPLDLSVFGAEPVKAKEPSRP